VRVRQTLAASQALSSDSLAVKLTFADAADSRCGTDRLKTLVVRQPSNDTVLSVLSVKN